MPIKPQEPAPAQQSSPYLPPGPEPLVFDQFEGINTSTTRPGVQDKQMAWSDSFFRVGPRSLRALPGLGPVLWNADLADTDHGGTEPVGTSIVVYDFANLGSTPVMIVVLSNGSIYQVNTSTGGFTRIAASGTIQNPSRLNVGMTQYGNQYVIIVAVQTDGYFLWSGTTFYAPGDSFGSDHIPTGISGSSVETYAGRVWVANGATVFFSAPGSIVDFSSGDGGGEFTSNDSFLRIQYTSLKQSNGFLYLVGDSSLNYISGVQTSGDPPVTTFTNQNADPEVGSPWPGTVDTFGRQILFANAFGAHVSYGATVTKISTELDGVYNSIPNFAGLIPSAAKAIVFGKKVWVLLLPIIDPLSAQQVNKLFLWDTKAWFPATQNVPLIFIQHQEINSIITAWGTDGFNVMPLFQTPAPFQKIAQTRLWDTPVGLQASKSVTRIWGMAQYYSITRPDITIDIDNDANTPYETIVEGPSPIIWKNNSDVIVTWQNDSLDTVEWFSSGGPLFVFGPTAVGQVGPLIGMTLKTNCPDVALISAVMQPDVVQGRY